MEADIADAVEQLRHERKIAVEVEDRTIRLMEPVTGDPGSAVLRVLGTAQAASPVGVASHGPGKVAVGVWRSPDLYLARWTNGKRWVVGYRLPGGAKPNDYVRIEGRIPTRLETDNWYGPVPPAVDEAFMDAGVLLDDPPFPVPPPPPRRRPPSPAPGLRRRPERPGRHVPLGRRPSRSRRLRRPAGSVGPAGSGRPWLSSCPDHTYVWTVAKTGTIPLRARLTICPGSRRAMEHADHGDQGEVDVDRS